MDSKIKTRSELKQIVESLKKQHKKIITTNGTFDILHVAHLRLLKKAKSLGDILIVLINSDSSVKRFKGDKRPIIPERERAEALSCLDSVDFVTIFSEDTPLDTLKVIKPDIHVKGGSFIPEKIKEEKELLESWNGKFKSFDLEQGYSTTNIIQKILDTYPHSAEKYCPKEIFNRSKLKIKTLSERNSKSNLSIMVNPDGIPEKITNEDKEKLEKAAEAIKKAKENNRPIIISFGAHLIKNGLSLILIGLMKKGYIQHILTNGASSIHDWEFAFQGQTEEDVKHYIKQGQFGIWHETGYYINEAIKQGVKLGLGYGESVGKLIHEEKLKEETIRHPYKNNSFQETAFKLKIPFSVCPGIGYDIIYAHPSCDGSAIGKASETDFLKFAKTLTNFEGGVYISVGSSITSPMVFEKALSMAKNLAIQENKALENYTIIVNDIQPGDWDWSKGEPPKDHPAYYLRFFKTFSRMGGNSTYIRLDNKAFLHNLYYLITQS